MTETEARKFIANEVSQLLWMRLAGFATVFGVANILALLGLWYSVTLQAESIAKERASFVAEEKALSAVDGARQRIETMARVAEDQVKGLVKNNSDLSTQLGRSEANLAALENSRKVLEVKLKDLESTAQAATANVANQFAKVAKEFASLPNDQRSSIMQAVEYAGHSLKSQSESLEKTKSDLAQMQELVRMHDQKMASFASGNGVIDISSPIRIVGKDGPRLTISQDGLEIEKAGKRVARLSVEDDHVAGLNLYDDQGRHRIALFVLNNDTKSAATLRIIRADGKGYHFLEVNQSDKAVPDEKSFPLYSTP